MPHSFQLHNANSIKSSIILVVYFRGRRYRKPLNESTYVADWNTKEQRCRVVKRNDLAEAINEKIDAWEAAVKDTIKHFTPLADTPPQEEFWRQFTSFLTESSDKSPGTFFVDFVEDYGQKVESTHSQPYRWRVPKSGEGDSTIWRDFSFENSTWNLSDISVNIGLLFNKTVVQGSDGAWYPSSGDRYFSSGILRSVSIWASSWTCTAFQAQGLRFFVYDIELRPWDWGYRSTGMSVRCVRE